MGIRNRTPIGTLREQRRSAESANQPEASKPKVMASVRARISSQMPSGEADPRVLEKGDSLLLRLRDVLKSDQGRELESQSDYQIIQDELSRIVQHHQQSRSETIQDLVDLTMPRKQIESRAPFRYIVIDGGKKTDEFSPIPKLERAPTNFDMYAEELKAEPAPKSVPLTLLLNPETESTPVKTEHDPSHEAAALTHNKVLSSSPATKGATLPKSLVLSLLDN